MDNQVITAAIHLDEEGDHSEASLRGEVFQKLMGDPLEDSTARTEDASSDLENSDTSFLLQNNQSLNNESCNPHHALQKVEELDDESDSALTLDDEYKFDMEDPSEQSSSFDHLSFLMSTSGHSKASAVSHDSTTSLKVFRRPSNDWKHHYDSLSFLGHEPGDNSESPEASENDADEEDLLVLCSRDSKRLKLLGEGAFGQVWLVRHNHKSYALKVCAKYDLIAEGAVHEVVREREIMSRLEHPFIARLWATNQDHDFVYILEDYLAGGELYSVMDRCPGGHLPARQVQVYTTCLAEALAYLHKWHIVYRDLKPENIMLNRKGFPTLIDFGCAKQLTAEASYQSRTLCGTPRFASPEMIDPVGFGGGHGVGTDHWALGILLYEMLAGESPFWYEDMPEMELYQQIPLEAVDFGPVRKYCSDEAAVDLIQGLLVKDPRQRLGAQGQSCVLEHPWLAPIHVLGEIAAPWVPDLTEATDTQYFDDWEDEVEDRFAQDYPVLTQTEEAHFVDF
jgi:hypothetical protein